MTRSILILAGLTAFAALVTASPPRPASAPTSAGELAGCVTAECHASVKQHKVVHGPVNVNACDACHTLTDARQHTYKLSRPKTELCGFCHSIDIEPGKVIHEPLARGECASCHDPHGGGDRNMLRGTSMNELCSTCHQDVIGDRKTVHGPVAAGACGACHEPHAADHPKLLRSTGNDLCLSCHQEMATQIETAKFKHQAIVEAECTQCHDAHASDHEYMIRQEPVALCTTSCHADIKHAVVDAKNKHSAVTRDKGCINCHTSHGGDLAALLKDQTLDLCLDCHRDPIKVNEKRTIPGMAALADDKLIRHGPLNDGSCAGCHDVHGSDVTRLLTKPYPEQFYTSFSVEKYDLCFTCHDKQLVQLPQTEGLTGFRNGKTNLHYLHVNKSKRGRVCRACHSTHTSPNALHIRESVPYGNWELPINFQQTKTGGSCAPGCHEKLAYDRDDPQLPVADKPQKKE